MNDEEREPSNPPRWEDVQQENVVSRLNARISDLEELVDSLVRVMAGRGRDVEVMSARITELEEFIAELENQ